MIILSENIGNLKYSILNLMVHISRVIILIKMKYKLWLIQTIVPGMANKPFISAIFFAFINICQVRDSNVIHSF